VNLHIGIPQAIVIGLYIGSLIQATISHGKSRGNYHAGWTLADFVIIVSILAWGGFFR
jgi:hypothetical protein